ncbi:hypothetical protein FRC12_020935 [Ceratobasidium sp. 428]|nr:hypothetical protein FRC12_020935 [Ceratobasidium sp. 428]
MVGDDVEMESAGGSEWETQESAWDEDICDPPSSSSATTVISSSLDVQHRLLYRGALSIPQSAILLEGIQFVAHLPAVTPPLLTAPLPIALELMRGRPSLRLLGTMDLSPGTIRLDNEIDVRLYIHPQSYVTHQYFHNTLALASHTTYIPERTLLRSPHPHPHIDPRITPRAVRIGLGEDVIVVYGRLQAEEYVRAEKGEVGLKMELVAAWVVDPASVSDSDEEEEEEEERVIVSGPRPPRPDDPLPREPRVRTILKRTDSSMPISGSGLQRAASIVSIASSSSSSGFKRTTSVLGTATGKKALAFGRVRSEVVIRGLGEPGIELDTPKPVKSTKPKDPTSSAKGKGGKSKGKSKAEEADDPFVVDGLDPGAVLPKMMARVKSGGVNTGGGEEVANKALIKRLAQSALETYGLDRDDEGFKEVFGYVTRGVGFAFRNKMKSEKIGRDELRKMVVRHVEMYVGGNGEVSAPA